MHCFQSSPGSCCAQVTAQTWDSTPHNRCTAPNNLSRVAWTPQPVVAELHFLTRENDLLYAQGHVHSRAHLVRSVVKNWLGSEIPLFLMMVLWAQMAHLLRISRDLIFALVSLTPVPSMT